jgi:xanthine/CO dehydrogenase XdhC/CoxF family maturation factor
MTHEIKKLIQIAEIWQQAGKKLVLATVVSLEGSSYRRPGVRMLLNDTGEASGTISGGCVENEVLHQAQSVFKSSKAKVMTYDGRLRMGCEGVITLLLEPFMITDDFRVAFNDVLQRRLEFESETYYYPAVGEYTEMGSLFILEGKKYALNPHFPSGQHEDLECFSQTFPPLFQLLIFGAEHDAVQLCKAASQLGWEVTIVASPDEAKTIDYFPGATRLIAPAFDHIETSGMDASTAVMVMSHSFHKDVQYMMALKDVKTAYFGLLGPGHRREQVLSKFLEYCPGASLELLDQLHGPAGINIGAESASEIAVSVLAEILSVVRQQEPMALREKSGSIHG